LKPAGRPILKTVDESSLLVDVNDSAAVVRINKPAKRNSLSVSTLHELDETLNTLLPREDLNGIIFTGTGNVFASGADIAELTELDRSSALQFSLLGQRVFQRIADAKQITIAAINGYCMGGALDLALSCDIRVASKNAVLSHPGAMRGIITGWGGTQRLPCIVGRSRAIEMFITGSRISSATALSIGLITEVGDPVLHCAFSLFRYASRSRGS
jgi:enoyl-CoA hydratase/carnithine racemase